MEMTEDETVALRMLRSISEITYPRDGQPVERTAATVFGRLAGVGARASASGSGFSVALAQSGWGEGPADTEGAWVWLRIASDGSGAARSNTPALLYALARWVEDGGITASESELQEGVLTRVPFESNRPLYDSTLSQSARTARNFDPAEYVRRMAEVGFTHIEVNALAYHTPYEDGVPGEYYAQFYTYCAGLGHFVDSTLTRGFYPSEYLQANLRRLKHLAALGRQYGLKPGILCFEPRTLPERFFQRYPSLRGARVDHPFRSHLPRYTLAQDHPASRDHYAQLVRNLMSEVPDIDYMSVWTNDSGAGFEHTASLYVGRNGGPYLIREWRNHEKIAQAAGESALRWLRLIRDTAAEFNPDFEVLLRIEPFKVEHDTITSGMGDGIAIEAPSLLVRGYHLPYRHPRYPEQESVAGTLFHTEMDPSEKEKLAGYRERGIEPRVTYSTCSSFNMEPLLGVPFARMLHQKLRALADVGLRRVNAFGGLLNTEATPYWPNPEVIRAFQLANERSVDDVLADAARRWAGDAHAADLLSLWDDTEEAVSYFPVVPLYSNFGFVWMRTWVRPLVPNLEAVPREDRLYFERFLVSTPNNPSINDLGSDVLFELITQESGERMAAEFDENVLPRLDTLLARSANLRDRVEGRAADVFRDLHDRIRALRCWATTMRNTCAWVAGVHGYLKTEDEQARDRWKGYLQEMIDRDLDNTRDLLDLWETSETEFILVSDTGETSFILGENLGDQLRRKIELTERYRNVEPYIDRDILWRIE